MITMLKSAALVALLAATTAVSAAPVAVVGGAPMVRVSYAGLNLAHPAGAAEFDRRIAHAVAAVCPSDGIALDRQVEVKHCRAAALKVAAAQREQVFAAVASHIVQLASR